MKTPQGVKKINESVLQDNRALILTDANKDDYDFNSLPDGTIYIDSQTGNEYIKLAGQSDWVARNVKNDNTIAIMKDSMVITEVFTVTKIDKDNNAFVYTTDTDQQRTGKIDGAGHLVFRLDRGSYIPGRNHLKVKVDGVLERTVAAGNLVEVSERRFYVTDNLEVGHVINAEYIKWIRIGNPYPRIYMAASTPESSEIGDLWIDSSGTLETTDDKEVNWNNIINKPNTLAGYGIQDAASKHHTHTLADISDIQDIYNNIGANTQNTTTKIETINNTLTSIQKQLTDIKAALDTKTDKRSIIISDTEPTTKKVGDIWFCTKTGNRLVATWNGASWQHYSAIWE